MLTGFAVRSYASVPTRLIAIVCLAALLGEAMPHLHAESVAQEAQARVAFEGQTGAPGLAPDDAHEAHRSAAASPGSACAVCRSGHGRDRTLRPATPDWLALAPSTRFKPLDAAPITTVADPHSVDPDLLLVSHALGEISAAGLDALLAIAQRSAQIVWVEAGSRTIARRLSEVRDRLLRDPWTVQLPCPHQGPCGALQAGEEHWCHGFASPPPEVFQDPFWRAAAQQLGIDLRALPYHYLVMTRSPAPCIAPQRRLLGRADVRNKLARCYVCDHTGLHHETIHKSTQPQLYRQLKKQLPPWLVDLGAVPPADPDS